MLALLFLSKLALAADSACSAPATAPRLDHVVIAIGNLAAAAARFNALGYRLKPGHLHTDNLVNEHVRFRDGSELELMTLAGPPGDRMAEASAARRLNLAPRRSTEGGWQFLSFPSHSDAGAVFFGSGGERPQGPDSLLGHANGASGLRDAWLEAGPGLARLLAMVGAQDCGPASGPGGLRGARHALNSTHLILVPNSSSSKLPRVLGVGLVTADSGRPRPQVRSPLAEFWIETW